MESEAKAMRKIKWGVMGTAFICERSTFPGMLQAENCEMYAIAGRNMEKAERFKETYGFQKAYGSYEKLLADPKVEAVYIPLPNTMHYEWTIRALKSGKHVLCEKPLAPTEAQAEEMFKAAEENHVYLMEAFAYQHSPYIAAVRKEIENGTIGDVRYMESAYITSDYDPIPRKKFPDKPALVVELKWDKSAKGAISQIKQKQYCKSLEKYAGNILLAGINYSKKDKKHQCMIEKIVK